MKFSATKEKLLEGLQQVQNVVSTRTTLPILSNVLLQAKGGEVHLTTTDLDVGVRAALRRRSRKMVPRLCRPVVYSRSFASFPRVKSKSKSMEKMLHRSGAGKAISRSSVCRKRNFRRCRSSKARKWSPFGRRICAMDCAKPLTRFRPTKRATC